MTAETRRSNLARWTFEIPNVEPHHGSNDGLPSQLLRPDNAHRIVKPRVLAATLVVFDNVLSASRRASIDQGASYFAGWLTKATLLKPALEASASISAT